MELGDWLIFEEHFCHYLGHHQPEVIHAPETWTGTCCASSQSWETQTRPLQVDCGAVISLPFYFLAGKWCLFSCRFKLCRALFALKGGCGGQFIPFWDGMASSEPGQLHLIPLRPYWFVEFPPIFTFFLKGLSSVLHYPQSCPESLR